MYNKINLKETDFVLEPGQFVLISTLQKIQYSNTLLPILDGRSTIARCGISIHQTCFACDGMDDRQNSITFLNPNNETTSALVLGKIYQIYS